MTTDARKIKIIAKKMGWEQVAAFSWHRKSDMAVMAIGDELAEAGAVAVLEEMGRFHRPHVTVRAYETGVELAVPKLTDYGWLGPLYNGTFCEVVRDAAAALWEMMDDY